MIIKQRVKQSNIELPLVISDHADWNELTKTIIKVMLKKGMDYSWKVRRIKVLV